MRTEAIIVIALLSCAAAVTVGLGLYWLAWTLVGWAWTRLDERHRRSCTDLACISGWETDQEEAQDAA